MGYVRLSRKLWAVQRAYLSSFNASPQLFVGNRFSISRFRRSETSLLHNFLFVLKVSLRRMSTPPRQRKTSSVSPRWVGSYLPFFHFLETLVSLIIQILLSNRLQTRLQTLPRPDPQLWRLLLPHLDHHRPFHSHRVFAYCRWTGRCSLGVDIAFVDGHVRGYVDGRK